MKVEFHIPLRGQFRPLEECKFETENWEFHFPIDINSNYSKLLIITISNVDEEHWPTLYPTKDKGRDGLPRFPFDINPNTLTLRPYLDHLRRLEAVLSLWGLEAFEFERTGLKWIAETQDAFRGMLTEIGSPELARPTVSEPIALPSLAACINYASEPHSDDRALSCFRVAQIHLLDRTYIDGFRYAYLCLEPVR